MLAAGGQVAQRPVQAGQTYSAALPTSGVSLALA